MRWETTCSCLCIVSGPAGERPQLHAAADEHRLGRRRRHRRRWARQACERRRRQLRASPSSSDDLDQREDLAVPSHALRLLHTRRLQRHAEHQAVSGDNRFRAAFSPIVVNFLLNVSRFSSGTTPTSGGCTPPSSSMRSSSTNPTTPDSSSSTCRDPPGTPTEMKTVSSTLRVLHFHLFHQIRESFQHVWVFLNPALFLMASRGKLHRLKKEVRSYVFWWENWLMTTVNNFLMSLWSQSLVSSLLQHS